MHRLLSILVLLLLSGTTFARQADSVLGNSGIKTSYGVFAHFSVETYLNEASSGNAFAEMYAGHVVGHVNTRLTRRLSYFAEVDLDATGGHGSQVSLERSVFKFDFKDAARLRIGRIHTPVSIWNSTFHHGQYLQTSVTRPVIVEYTTRFSPIHSLAIEFSGVSSRRWGRVEYLVGVANQDNSHGHEETADSHAKNPAYYSRLSVSPARVVGLSVGASLFRERLDNPDHHEEHSSGHLNKTVAAVHTSLQSFRWELMAEFMTVSHQGSILDTPNWGFYVQPALRIGGVDSRVKLYARGGRMEKSRSDPFFASDDCFTWKGLTGGIRFDIAPLVALTAEYRQYGETSLASNRDMYLQISTTF